MADIFDQYASGRPEIKPTIYAFKDNNPNNEGLLKIGYTEQDVQQRLSQIYTIKTADGKSPFEIVWTESALYEDGTSFMDHEVHRALNTKGIKALNKSEWFKCSVSDVKAAILAVKEGTLNIENRIHSFKMRPEQESAVNITKSYFEAEALSNKGRSPKFLWNAKMRFGKTFASYQLAKSMNMKRVLVLTFKPAVQSAWEEDIMTHIDFEGWQYYSNDLSKRTGKTPEMLDQDKPIVCFGSFQDFLGTNSSGGIKAKNEWVHTTNWDMVIFDEYHFGAWRENAKNLFMIEDEDSYDTLDVEKYKEEEADNAYNETFLPITTDHYLFLSGTPFRALNTGEFIENQIFSWTYTDEQNAKENWIEPESNPYEALPKMVMLTYKIPDSIKDIATKGEFNEFDLNVFFEAKVEKGKSIETAEFVSKEHVQKWLDLIRGAYAPTAVDDLKLGQGQKPVMPYSDTRLLNVLNHTFWFLPGVASCYAMKNLLEERQNVFYHDYKINVTAGTKAGIGVKALEPVIDSMDPALETKTITLSCGKLTTGVTVRPWTGIFMLRNLSTPETYFQAAFRVQSPWEMKKEDGSNEIMKRECYIFDFALDRALRQVSDYSNRLNVKESNPEKKVGAFINYLPVLAYDGATMQAVSAKDILDITMAGTSATLLARRWESALLVNVDNDTLTKLLTNQEALDALMSIEGFRSLNKDLETIINKSEKVKKAKKDGNPLTPKEKNDLTKEEKEAKSLRKQIQEKLIKFATRIPIFIYLTDFREYSLKDVITQFEPALFKKVTGLTIPDFELLVSLGLFNESLMNEAVYKFKLYEDSSLEYAGIGKRPELEDVGLFSTVISHDDYVNMAKEQNLSMQKEQKPVIFKKAVVLPSKEKIKKKEHVPIAAEESENLETKEEQTLPKEDEIIEIDVQVGMKVEHKKFGKGTVIDKPNDDTITVEFDNVGIKNMVITTSFGKGFLKVVD